MKNIIAIIIIWLGCILALYVGGWLMFIKSIIDLILGFQAGMVTGSMIALAIIKILFASIVGGIIAYIGFIIAAFIAG